MTTPEQGERAAAMRIALLTALGRTLRRALRGLDDEAQIYEQACLVAVETGRFRYAWIGIPDLELDVVRPVAEAGRGEGYADRITVSLRQDAAALGPTSVALREHRTVVCADIALDPRMAPWRDEALSRGLRSSGAFPFSRGGVSAGTLNVYADAPGFADPLEQYLLEGIAEDLGDALDRLDRERAHADFEARLAASERRHRAIFEDASDGIFVFDDEGRIVDVNAAGCALSGRARGELVGRTTEGLVEVSDAVEGGEASASDAAAAGAHAGRVPFTAERRMRRPDGALVDVEIHGVRLADGSAQWLVRDVSERKRSLGERAAVERMTALGRLAQGVGHEINNPLAFLVLSLELAREATRALPSDTREALDTTLVQAQEGADRIARIVRSLATFGRGDAESVGPVSLARALEAAVMLTANRVKHVAPIQAHLDRVPLVRANEFQLTQVFVNLLLNAVDAMEAVARPDHHIGIGATTQGDRVIVEVADTGSGIPERLRDRVFDPYFTTKAIGRGTGLGLSISRSIVQMFGGALDIVPSAGVGATFRLTLPVAPAPAPAPQAPPSAPVDAGRLRVLVVEDEPIIARNVKRILKQHDVVLCDTPAAAIELCQRESFDRIVCDLMFPGGSAESLFDALVATRPALARRVIFMTGGAFTPSAQAFLERAGRPCLAKPFDGAQLVAALADVAVSGAP